MLPFLRKSIVAELWPPSWRGLARPADLLDAGWVVYANEVGPASFANMCLPSFEMTGTGMAAISLSDLALISCVQVANVLWLTCAEAENDDETKPNTEVEEKKE